MNPCYASLCGRTMEDHPRKRRKTSPLTSVTLNISNTPTRAASEDGSRSTPFRPSFMSPTKASLARFNPHLLHPSVPAESEQQDQTTRQSQLFGEKQRLEPSMETKMVNNIHVAPPSEIQPAADSQESIEGRTTESLALDSAPPGDGFRSSPRRTQTPPIKLPSAKQLQASVEQDPRASSPKPEGNEVHFFLDTVSIHKASGLEGSISEHMNPGIGTNENEIEQTIEPEPALPFTPTKNVLEDAEYRLPSTPSQLGLEAPPSPPKGLSFSSTTRRLKKRKRSKVKPSPLNPSPATKPVENPPVSGLGPRIPVTSTQPSKTAQLEVRIKGISRPYVLFSSEVFSLQLTKQFRAASKSNSHVDISRKSSTLSRRLALFLPFSRPLIPDPDSSPPDLTSQNDAGALRIDTTETCVPCATSNDSSLRHQSIVITSPQQLLVVEFQLKLDQETGKNSDLTVSSISPWADFELGPWLRTEAVQLDKPIIEQTISRYWEISEIRAFCWYRCEQDLVQNAHASVPISDPALGEPQDITSLPTKPHPGGPTDNAARPCREKSVSNPLDDNTTNHDPSPKAWPIPHRSLHHHLGQQSILFTYSPSTSLLITWRLTISPAGVVHSNLSAQAAFPDAWTQAPGGQALGKVEEAFDLLVEQVGVFQAVKVVWGLLFGA